jgi:antitoxin (DNA-binding transcriptional repressor) of toxin-antitoxin stability system
MSSPNVLTLSVSQFKAQCLELFEKLSRGEISRVIVTKRGAVVATVAPATGRDQGLVRRSARRRAHATRS